MGDLSVDHAPAVADHSPGPSKLSVSTREVVGWGVGRQPIISSVCSQAGRNSLMSPESGGSTPAPMGGESIDSSSSSVCRGHSQRGCLLSLATQRSVRFQVDPSAGSGGSTGPLLASELRSICHGSESSDASLLLLRWRAQRRLAQTRFFNAEVISRYTPFLLFGWFVGSSMSSGS